MNSERNGSLFVLAAGILWGCMGLFVRPLTDMGLDSLQISCVRMVMAAVLFDLLLLVKNPRGFAIHPRDLGWFAAMGVGSVAVMTASYFTSIQMNGLGVAAILLYTSPIWITLMARIFFKEKLTRRKLCALILAFGGCVLVSGGALDSITPLGILMGLTAGLSYSLYSIFGVVILKKYEPLVITSYVFTIAALALTLMANPVEIPRILSACPTPERFGAFALSIGIVTAFFPYLLYTVGLSRMEVGKAGIVATVEPMVATILGIVVYHEAMTVFSLLGILGILGANVLLNVSE